LFGCFVLERGISPVGSDDVAGGKGGKTPEMSPLWLVAPALRLKERPANYLHDSARISRSKVREEAQVVSPPYSSTNTR
jgi:hypothetical protein